MLKRLLIFSVLCFLQKFNLIKAQEGYTPIPPNLCPNCRTGGEDFTAPYLSAEDYDTYNQYSLASPGDVPVDLYTGQPGISLPIYNIQMRGGYSFPISIKYDASGIKVAQQSSPIGLGWNLSAGAPITRTIRGGDDFVSSPDATDNPANYLSTYYFSYLSELGCINGMYNSANNQEITYTFNKEKDLQADVFSFSAGGYSAKFVLEPRRATNRQVILLVKDKIRIKLIYTANITIPSIEVTTPDGTKYFYGSEPGFNTGGMQYYVANTRYQNLTKVESTEYLDNGTTRTKTNEYVTAWLLRKVITPLNEEINFTYNYTYGYTLSSTTKKLSYVYKTLTDLASTVPNQLQLTEDKVYENNPLIDKITFPLGQVSFTASSGRLDRTSSDFYLTNISIKSQRDFVKTYKLEHTFFNSQLNVPVELRGEYLRMKFTSLQEYSNGVATKPPYLFTYNESVNCGTYNGIVASLPSKKSVGMDHWGYFNNRNAGVSILKPTREMFNINGSTYYFDGLERDVYPQYLQAGMLTKITYPAGGYSEYTYEPNTYSNSSSLSIPVSGLRIKQIKTSEGTPGKDRYTVYKYNTTDANYIETTSSSGVLLTDIMYTRTNINGWPLIRSGASILPVNSHSSGAIVGYSEVEVYNGLNGELGKTVNRYHSLPNYSYDYFMNTPGLNAQNFKPIGYYAYCYDNIQKLSPAYAAEGSANKNYLYVKNGLLKESTSFSKKGSVFVKVSSIFNSYNNDATPANMGISLISNAQLFGMMYKGFCLTWSTISALGYSTPYLKLKLTSTKSIIYDEASPTNSIGSLTTYDYSNDTHYQLTKKCVTDLADNSISYCENYIYPADYTALAQTTGQIVNNMGDVNSSDYRHIHNRVVETYTTTKLDGIYKVTSGSVTQYKFSDPSSALSPIIPGNTYTLNTDVPLILDAQNSNNPGYFGTSVNKSYKVNNNLAYFLFDNDYESVPAVSNTGSDSWGNITESTSSNTLIPSSSIYGFNGNLLVAQAMNATRSQISYAGFEEATLPENGWTSNSTPIFMDKNNAAQAPYVFLGRYSLVIPKKGSSSTAVTFGTELTPKPQQGKYKVSFCAKTDGSLPATFFSIQSKKSSDATNAVYPNINGAYMNSVFAMPLDWMYIDYTIDLDYLKANSDGSDLTLIFKFTNADPNGNLYIDDLKIAPVDAQMTTISHEPLVGETAIVDPNNNIIKYEYDFAKRLKLVRDGDGNILENYNYVLKP